MSRYRRLLGYATPYWRGWVVIVAVMLGSTLFALLQPWPLKVVVDQVLGSQPATSAGGELLRLLPGATTRAGLLAWMVLAGLAIFAANSALDVLLTFTWIRVAQRTVYDLAADLFVLVQRRSLIFHSRTPVGDSLSRITGDSWVVHTVIDALLFEPARATITLVGALWLMLQLDPLLTGVALIALPLLAAVSFLLRRPARLAARIQRQSESRLQVHVQQILRSIPVVQAFAQEAGEQRRFQTLGRAVVATHQRSILLTKFYSLGSGLITTLNTAAILLIGAQHVLAGSLSIGSLLVFLSYLGLLQAQLKSLTGIYRTLQGASASIERIMELLEAEPEVRDAPGARPLPPVRGHVRLEDVSFGYDPDHPVLRGVSLELRPGQTLALVGPTGAGKTTLAGLLPRFFDPWTGRVLLDGHDLRTVQLKSLREQVALVLQEPFLFPVSIAENIAYGRPGADRAAIEAVARAANAHAFITRLPQGYETVVGEGGATLSGGERQRLAIARALLKDAPLLILDEPTSALDAETEHLVLDALRRLMAGRTTLIIAHRLSTIRDADQIAVLREGKIVEMGTRADLLARDGFYARLRAAALGAAGEERDYQHATA